MIPLISTMPLSFDDALVNTGAVCNFYEYQVLIQAIEIEIKGHLAQNFVP